MNASKRLKVVVGQAQREEEAAARRFEQSRQMLAAEQKRLQDLDSYYQEYESRFKSRQQGIRASELQSGREFLQQLAESQQVQAAHIARLQADCDVAKQAWYQCHLKVENLAQYVENLAREETRELDRREQKRLDEWSGQAFARRQS